MVTPVVQSHAKWIEWAERLKVCGCVDTDRDNGTICKDCFERWHEENERRPCCGRSD